MTTKTKTTCLRDEASAKAWRTVKLGDVAMEARDLYQPKKDEHLPYIGLEHIERQTLRLLGVGDSRNVQSTKKRFKKEDVLFGSLRAYFRKVARPRMEGVCSTDITVLRPKNNQLDSEFLFYLVGNKQFVDRAAGQGEGTRMPRAGWSVISHFNLDIPKNLDEQKGIAGVLAAFDEKIENNNRIIKALEKMAQTIFKEWFVNFRFPGHEKAGSIDFQLGKIPKGWKVMSAKQLVKRLPQGKTYRPEELNQKGEVPVYDQSSGVILGYHNDEPALSATIDEPIAIFGDHTCRMKLIIHPFSLGPNVVPFVGEDYPTLFVYFLVSGHVVQREYKRHWSEFEQQEFVVPPTAIAEEYADLIKPMVQKIVEAENENQKLAAMRDLLLPRLMSGEIRV